MIYYVATTGDDFTGDGSLGNPWATWAKGASVLVAGDTLYIRGGSYASPFSPGASDWIVTIANLTGTSSSQITISAYPGETPILDLNTFDQTNNTTGVRVNSCVWTNFIGLGVINIVQNAVGNIVAGWDFHQSKDINLIRCFVDSIQGAGIRQSKMNGLDTTPNARFKYINCDASNCGDPIDTGGGVYGNADGFDCNEGTATYINCRSWGNSDDGFDCFNNDSVVQYQGCWSFWNGYIPGTFTDPGSQADGMGFKWGTNISDLRTTHLRTYTNCISFQNKAWGFDQNAARCIAWFYNNTSYDNGLGGWATGYGLSPRAASVLINNISYADPITVSDFTGLTENYNSWDSGFSVSGADFLSLDTTGVDGARDGDGNLPDLDFLHLANDSALIDAGVDVGLLFNGAAPDLGAYESGSASAGSSLPILSIIINFTPCDTMPPEGYDIQYRVIGDTAYIDAGLHNTSPAIINVEYPAGTHFEGFIRSDCGDVLWTV